MLLIGLVLVVLVIYVGTRLVDVRPSKLTMQRPVQHRRVWDRHALYSHATRDADPASTSEKRSD
jgi:hypothetical protein